MNGQTLKEILKVNFLSFTKEEIENIMQEELEKTPEEMDTELIDMCLEILMGEPKEEVDEKLTDSSAVSDKKVKRLNFKKGILVAAIIMLLISIAIPVGAKIFDIDVSESILKVYEEHFRLDTEGESRSEDLAGLLAENDLSDIVLPRYLYTDCNITSFSKKDENFTNQVIFEYIDKEQRINGRVAFTMYDICSEFLDGEMLVDDQYDEAKQITVNGINVIVLNEANESLIVYLTNGTEYNIELKNVSLDKAIEIASTL